MGGEFWTYEAHAELETTWKLGPGRLGVRAGGVSTWFWLYGGNLSAVYRVTISKGARAAWVAGGALGLEVGAETLSNKATAWVTAIASAESGVEIVLGSGRLGIWVRLQAKTPSSVPISPSGGLFVGYTL